MANSLPQALAATTTASEDGQKESRERHKVTTQFGFGTPGPWENGRARAGVTESKSNTFYISPVIDSTTALALLNQFHQLHCSR